MCTINCDKLCPNLVFSDSVTVQTISGVDTLIIDIPAPATDYYNCRKICLVLTETIPATATIDMPVAVSIGGVTTTIYPLVDCSCVQVIARQLSTRYKYKVKVLTNVGSDGVFKVYNLPICIRNEATATLTNT